MYNVKFLFQVFILHNPDQEKWNLNSYHYNLSPLLTAIFPRWTWVCQYQNITILDFIGIKNDGGGGWQLEIEDVQSSSQIVTNSKSTPKPLQHC